MWHWLAINVWPTALHTTVAGITAVVIVAPFRSALAKVWRAVRSLDPEEDYGVTKQLAEVNHAPLAHHRR